MKKIEFVRRSLGLIFVLYFSGCSLTGGDPRGLNQRLIGDQRPSAQAEGVGHESDAPETIRVTRELRGQNADDSKEESQITLDTESSTEILDLNGKLTTPEQLRAIREGAVVDPSLEVSDDRSGETQGVLVELQSEPVLKVRGEAKEKGSSHTKVVAAAGKQHSLVTNEHRQFKQDLASIFAGRLVPFSQKAIKGKIRTKEFKHAFNGMALFDISMKEAKQKLQGLASVKKIWPNSKMRANLNDSVGLTKSDQVWAYVDKFGSPIDGMGMRVGIIDTGIEYTNPDLGGCLGPACKVLGGYDFVADDSDPMDEHGHGTHVAATVAGVGSYLGSDGQNHSLFGVAPGAKLYAYRVLDASGSGWSTAIIAAIERCADPDQDGDSSDRLDVCSMSLGGSGNPDDPTSTAVDNASANGVVFAIAAGNSGPNNGTIGSPGTARKAITVAAACKPKDIGTASFCTEAIASFSSRGPVTWTGSNGTTQTLMKPDVAAPGVFICAAEWGTFQSSKHCLDSRHIAISGTSMATPHIAGVAALIRQAHPEFHPDEVKQILIQSARNLGLPENVQGKGMVDALAALEASGIPYAPAKIQGLPLSFFDEPTTTLTHFSKTLSITNTTSQTLTFIPRFETTQVGFSTTFDESSLVLAPNGAGTLLINFQVDHRLVPSGLGASGSLTLSTAAGEMRLPVTVSVASRLRSDVAKLDFPFDDPEQPRWAATKTVVLTNTLIDLPANYSVSAVFELPAGTPPEAIRTIVSPSNLFLAPGGTGAIQVNLDVENGLLANGRYSGFLNLTSPLQSLKIPVSFYKGYAANFVYSGPAPTIVNIYSTSQRAYVFGINPAPSDTSTFIPIHFPGPYAVEAYWPGSGAAMGFTVVKANIPIVNGLVSVPLSQTEATHKISFKAVDPKGVPIPVYSGNNINVAIAHKTFGFLMLHGYNGYFNQNRYVMVSDIPSDHEFLATGETGAILHPDEMHIYQYKLSNGLTRDFEFVNLATDFIEKVPMVFQNRNLELIPSLYNYNCFDTATYTRYCVSSTRHALPLTPTPKKVFLLNSDPSVDVAAFTGNLQGLMFNVYLNGEGTHTQEVYLTPNYYFSKNYSYSWFEDRAAPVEIAPGNAIPIGVGPVLDTTQWVNYANTQLRLTSARNNYGLISPWSDPARNIFLTYTPWLWGGVCEDLDFYDYFGEDPVSTINLSKDGQPIKGGVLTATLPQHWPNLEEAIGAGNYQLELRRTATLNGIPTEAKTVSKFKVVSASSLTAPWDENPPYLTSLHLIANGLWQNVVDPNTANSLVFKIDPNPGFIDVNLINRMQDSLTSVKLESSLDAGQSWVNLALASLGDGKFSSPLPTNGQATLYSYRITALDIGGNSLSYSFQVPNGKALGDSLPSDTMPPTVQISSPSNGTILSGPFFTIAHAQDNVGVARVDFYVDAVLVGTDVEGSFGLTIDSKAFSNGLHLLTAKAYDLVGNEGVSSGVSVTFSNIPPDNTPPLVAITSPADGATLSGFSVNVTASASDNSEVFWVNFYLDDVLLNSDPTSPYSITFDSRNFNNGAHTLHAVASDPVGNKGTSSSISVRINNDAPPTVAITSPENGATVLGVFDGTVSALDDVGVTRVEFYLDGSVVYTDVSEPYGFSLDSTKYANGMHSLRAGAYDAAGQRGLSNTISITVNNAPPPDITAPAVAITSPANGATVSNAVEVTASASDAVGVTRVDFYRDGVFMLSDDSAPYSAVFDSKMLANGAHSLQAKAYDVAGNEGVSGSLSVSVFNAPPPDTTAPAVAITSPANGTTVSGSVDVAASASDAVGVTRVDFFRDGVLISSDDSSPYSAAMDTKTIVNGSHSVLAKAYDAAGNMGTSSSITVTVYNAPPPDTTSPIALITSPADGSTVKRNSTVSILVAASDNIGVTKVEISVKDIQLNTTLVLSCAKSSTGYVCPWRTPSKRKAYALQAKAFDEPGNIGSSATFTVTVR